MEFSPIRAPATVYCAPARLKITPAFHKKWTGFLKLKFRTPLASNDNMPNYPLQYHSNLAVTICPHRVCFPPNGAIKGRINWAFNHCKDRNVWFRSCWQLREKLPPHNASIWCLVWIAVADQRKKKAFSVFTFIQSELVHGWDSPLSF